MHKLRNLSFDFDKKVNVTVNWRPKPKYGEKV